MRTQGNTESKNKKHRARAFKFGSSLCPTPPTSGFLSLVFFLLQEENYRSPCEPSFWSSSPTWLSPLPATSLLTHHSKLYIVYVLLTPKITLQVPWSTPSETAPAPVTLFKIQTSEHPRWPEGCHWPQLLKRHKEQESPQQSAGKQGSVEIHTGCGQQLPLVPFFTHAKAVKVGRVQLLTIYYM